MKKNRIQLIKILLFRKKRSKQLIKRFSTRTFFFKQTFFYFLKILNLLKNLKTYYFYNFNFYLISLYYNWLFGFSWKYYTVYFDDIKYFNFKLLSPLKKSGKYLGNLNKFFFLKPFLDQSFLILFFNLNKKYFLNKFYFISVYKFFLMSIYKFFFFFFFKFLSF